MIKETFYNLRREPVVSTVTVVGTALSIFLIMVFVMMQQVKVAPFAPESNRDRMLHYRYVSFTNDEWGDGQSNGCLSWKIVRELFHTFKDAETVTGYTDGVRIHSIGLPGSKTFSADVRETDADYFKVFDLDFVSGKPFSQEDFEAGIPLAVIDTNISSALFGTADAVGRTFTVNGGEYRVAGVVRPVSPLATNAYGQLWINTLSTDTPESGWSVLGGPYSVTMLTPEGRSNEELHADFDRHFREYSKELAKGGWSIIPRNRPYNQEADIITYWANEEADLETYRHNGYIIYAILLLVPAINLSSMTHSRLRRRVSEIAVRRAFGATRLGIFAVILNENLLITLLGGLLGLILSVVTAFFFSDLIFAQPFAATISAPTVSPAMLLRWSTFGWALLFCFLLNMLSAGFPAMQMSRIGLVNSLRGGENK